MKPSSKWRTIVRHSFSFWGNVLLALAMGIAGGFSEDGTFYWGMALANALVAYLRIVFQKEFADADQ